MQQLVSIAHEQDGIAVVTIDYPPVNALGGATRQALHAALEKVGADGGVRAIVIACAGRTFCAGADIAEFGKPPVKPRLRQLCDLLEGMGKPVIAAVHGAALGGGLELVLACRHAIAVPSARLGLPEVNLGILPGAGGTQRLPRIVGVEAALDMIVGGNPVPAGKALELGLIDALAEEGRLREDAIAFARRIVAEGTPSISARDRADRIEAARAAPSVFDDYLAKNARKLRGFKAPGHIVEAVRAAVESPSFEEGMRREAELLEELEASTESRAQRYYFFAERETRKIPDVSKYTPTVPVRTVAVIGAGTMGGGIAMAFLNAGFPVTLVEMNEAALERGVGIIRTTYEGSVRKGQLSTDAAERRMAQLHPVVGLDTLADTDLIIEAVFEEMSVKQAVFRQLDGIAKPDAILASNTSFLDLDQIAGATARPERVVGLHFFSPAHIMRLLEVVRGRATAPEVIATAMDLGKIIGKVPVLSRVCHGFITNRIMSQRSTQAYELVLQGPSPCEIDDALYEFGFAMGPFQMFDLVGLDVLGREDKERTLRGDLVNMGRLGQKSGAGFYDYDERRKPGPSSVVEKVIRDFARFRGIDGQQKLSAGEIVGRLLYPVVNEAFKVLEEGIAIRASDIDAAIILGYNWPIYRGGPIFWGETVGLDTVAQGLRAMGIEPSALLIEKAGQAALAEAG